MDDEIQALIEQLSDSQFSARKVAARKLERIGLPAAPALRQALYSRNPILAMRAAQLLGVMGDTAAIPHLRELLESDNVDIYGAASEALRNLARHQQSTEARDKILGDLNAARENSPHISQRPALFAPSIPKKGTDLSRASAPNSISQAQRRAVLTLPEDIPGLIATLKHKDYQKRSAATNALVERGKEAAIPLVSALLDNSPVVRQRAAEAIARIQDMAPLNVLLDLMREEMESQTPDSTVVSAFRDASLALINAPNARQLLIIECIAMVRLVYWQAHVGLSYSLFVLAANRLKDFAAESPTPELRTALPYLKGLWPFVPREFSVARKAIEEATKEWANLPIASVEPASEQQNLPRPATETSTPPVPPENLPRPTEQSKRVKPPPLPTELNALVVALDNPNEEWCRRVEGALLLRGSEAVSPLQHAFVQTTSVLYRARITGVLAGIGDIAGLPFLWVAWRDGLESQTHVSLKPAMLRMAPQLPDNHQRIAFRDLMMMLSESRESLPGLAELTATALERRAKETPTPELRSALPLLKGTWLHTAPPAFDRARAAIENATEQWADLPIASARPTADTLTLPRPATEATKISLENLPRPSKEQQ